MHTMGFYAALNRQDLFLYGTTQTGTGDSLSGKDPRTHTELRAVVPSAHVAGVGMWVRSGE